jgi:serine/threonine-protein kinase HipA
MKTIFVHAGWMPLAEPVLMGLLRSDVVRGEEIFSFEYDRNWLKNPAALFLDPDLQLYPGQQYTRESRRNFGLFLYSSPDRWGRVLIDRKEVLTALKEGRSPRKLRESDYLLGVFDEQRAGALRLGEQVGGPFLNADRAMPVPPLAMLKELERASRKVEKGLASQDPAMLKWIDMLLAPGSSLGGARPKAGVAGESGDLWIAKFPSSRDDHDTGGWEMVVRELAGRCGIRVPEARAISLSGDHHTFLSRRFDRAPGRQRIHFASAMTLLGYNDGADFHDGVSYLELAEFIQRMGANPGADLEELWRRIVFNICVSNTDDHLRNHGFLLGAGGWKLSPAFDINPNPRGQGLSLNISETDNSLSTEVALSVAGYFRLSQSRAREILLGIKGSVSGWRRSAQRLGIGKPEQDLMEPAFMTA